MAHTEPLKFSVHPHIVEDLGLNLYTDLPRVLVEFVANAYDADSASCDIQLDFERISNSRSLMRAEWESDRKRIELERMKDPLVEIPDCTPLDERTLPDDVSIVIADTGHGMSRDDLEEKFLVTGRRRREEKDGHRSPNGRVVMGRKGLGKLAGFGVAHLVEVVSRREGDSHATKITLDFDDLVRHHSTDEIKVPTEHLDDGGGLDPHGTRITLSRLLYDPVKSRNKTIAHEIGDHFALVDVADFVAKINGTSVEPTPRTFAFGYPQPDLPEDELVEEVLVGPDGREFKYKYRLRFTPPRQHLAARERGVRVYAHRRLASAPDLLDAPTGMHGFRMTDYLDGVVHADFIDEQPTEYIATDRQSLRWEVPLLTPLRAKLSKDIAKACDAYQKYRDSQAEREAREDPFTKEVVQRKKLPPYKQRIAYKIAGELLNHLPGGKEAEEYKKQLEILMDGLGQGTILQAVADIAKEDTPDLNRLVARATELTQSEVGEFVRFVEGRLDAIHALRKICRAVNFKAGKNEKQLHELFNRSPWLIDTTFTQYMTSDQPQVAVFDRLAQELQIGRYATSPEGEDDEKRPDLVFLLGNKAQGRLVIVELKAPNVPLSFEHLNQLKGYMMDAQAFLDIRLPGKKFTVEGYLMGSMPKDDSAARGAKLLRSEMATAGPTTLWNVMDIEEVLDRTESAHEELLTVYERVGGTTSLPEFDLS